MALCLGLLALAGPARALTIRGDHDWVSSAECPEGWAAPELDDSSWTPVAFPWLLIWPSPWEPDPDARPFWEANGAPTACTRRTFELPSAPAGPVRAYVFVDDDYELWINGERVGESNDQGAERPGEIWDVTARLRPGRNVIGLKIIDAAYEKGAWFSLRIPALPEQAPSRRARLRALHPWAEFAGIVLGLAAGALLLRLALRRLQPWLAAWPAALVAPLTLALAIACQYVLLTQELYSAPPEQPYAEWAWPQLGLAAALFLLLYCLRDADAGTDEGGALRGESVWLAFILLVGLALRVWRIDSVPVGFYQDEATNGIDALLLMDPAEPWQLWSDSVGGRPTLFLYALGVVLKLTGPTYLGLKILPVAISVLSIVAVWAFGRVGFGARPALWAALFLAVSRWDVHYARMAWEVNCVPLFSAAGFALLLRGLAREPARGRGEVVAGAVVLALGLYTYAAYRAIAAGAALFLLWTLLSSQRALLRRHLRGLVLAGVAAGAVSLPLVLFGLANPERYWERYRDVALTHYISYYGTPIPWLHQIGKGLLSLNHLGDELIRHNLPRAPQLDAITCVFFLLGLASAARPRQRLAARLLWAWFLAFLALASLTRDAPHATRYLGLVAPAVLFAGLGAARLFARLTHLLRWRPLVWPLAATAAAALVALNAYQYFVVEANDRNADFEMNLTARVVCERLARAKGVNAYWTSDVAYWAGGPCHYLARGSFQVHDIEAEDVAGGRLGEVVERPALVFVGPELLEPGRGLVERDEHGLPKLGLPGYPMIQRDRQGNILHYFWELR